MSIVPYNNNNEIVYKNDGILVVHNNQQNTIQLLSTNDLKGKDHQFTGGRTPPTHKCPNCGFLWSQTNSDQHVNVANVDPYEFNRVFQSLPQGFMHHEYFKLLEKFPKKTSSFTHDIFNQGYFKKFFRKIPPYELGSGAHAFVYKVVHILNEIDLGVYAVKRISVGDKLELLDQVLNEVLILYELSVKGANENNLIRYNHVWLEMGDLDDLSAYYIGDNRVKTDPIPYVFILQQYCDGGHVEDMILKNFQSEKLLSEKDKINIERIKRRKKRSSSFSEEEKNLKPWLTELEIWKFFKDIATGVNYLHLHGIIHRDLKPSNCLIEEKYQNIEIFDGPFDNKQDFLDELDKLPKVLISDFGEGLFIDKHNIPEPNGYIGNKYNADYERCGNTGTLEFTAPELWLYAYPDSGGDKGFMNRFTYESDVYSLGLILCFLCVGELPFSDQLGNEVDPQKVRENILEWYDKLDKENFSEWFSKRSNYQDFGELVYSMIKGPNRASCSEILSTLEIIKNQRFLVGLEFENSARSSRRSSVYIPEKEKFTIGITSKLYIVNFILLEIISVSTETRSLEVKLVNLAALFADINEWFSHRLPIYIGITVITLLAIIFVA